MQLLNFVMLTGHCCITWRTYQ